MVRISSLAMAAASLATSVTAINGTTGNNGTAIVGPTSVISYSPGCPPATSTDDLVTRAPVATSEPCGGSAPAFTVIKSGSSMPAGNGTITYTVTKTCPVCPEETIGYSTIQPCPVCPVQTVSYVSGYPYINGSVCDVCPYGPTYAPATTTVIPTAPVAPGYTTTVACPGCPVQTIPGPNNATYGPGTTPKPFTGGAAALSVRASGGIIALVAIIACLL